MEILLTVKRKFRRGQKIFLEDMGGDRILLKFADEVPAIIQNIDIHLEM